MENCILKSPGQCKTIYINATIVKSQTHKLIKSCKPFIEYWQKKPHRGDALTRESSHEIHNGQRNFIFILLVILFYYLLF